MINDAGKHEVKNWHPNASGTPLWHKNNSPADLDDLRRSVRDSPRVGGGTGAAKGPGRAGCLVWRAEPAGKFGPAGWAIAPYWQCRCDSCGGPGAPSGVNQDANASLQTFTRLKEILGVVETE